MSPGRESSLNSRRASFQSSCVSQLTDSMRSARCRRVSKRSAPVSRLMPFRRSSSMAEPSSLRQQMRKSGSYPLTV